MKALIYLVTLVISQVCYAPPVTQNKNEGANQDSEINGLEDYMEYHRYLKEVVNALESDPDFRAKLEKADEKDIKSGRIAEELQFVSHNVRTRLDEIKRVELIRLKELVEKKRQLEDPNSIIDDPVHHHLDHSNPHTFEIEDLKKLIAKTTADLAEADRKRKEQFKQYEMEKEYQKQEKLNHTSGEEREKLEKELKEMEEKHKKHEKLHEPGHKKQLEEVWEEQDHMQQDFDPKTFFMLHDVDGNGLWDQDEVKALFVKELDKMYQQGHPEDDMRERVEEMERMRESVFQEMDTNRDGFIDYSEFMKQTNSNDFKQDNGWQSLDEQKPYTDEELAEYIRYHQQNMPPQGWHDPNMPQGGIPQQGYQQMPQGNYQGYPPQQGGYQPQHGGYQQGGHQQQQGGYQHQQGGYQQQQGGYQHQQGGYQQQQGGQHQQQNGYQQQQGGHQQQQGGYHQQQGYQQPQADFHQSAINGIHSNEIPHQNVNNNEIEYRNAQQQHSPQGHSPQGNSPQGNSPQGNSPQQNSPQGNPPGGYSPQGNSPQGNSPQGNSPQGNSPQGNPPGGYSPQGNSAQGNPPGGYSPQGHSPQGNSPQGNSPQGNPPGGYSPQGNSAQGNSPQGNPPGGYSPQGNSQQGNPPQALGPQGGQQ